ncbi:DUF397 domain-containing protein [Streptomyces sp. NPDC001667]
MNVSEVHLVTRHNLSRYRWRKASYSVDAGGNCVEIQVAEDLISIRDSKSPVGPILRVSANAYRSFTEAVRQDTLRTTKPAGSPRAVQAATSAPAGT